MLPVVVSLAIGLILFEGGLTLDLRGSSRGSNAITGLLTVGVLVTWLSTAAAARLCFGIDWPLALLAGSIVIVTGPTVVGPLLKRLQIEPKLHHILHWEGVLIDAIGVFVATLCFEWIAGHSGRVAVGIMLVVRTLNVLASTLGTSLTWREKTFLAWIAPRGIVAASLASLFAIALAANPSAGTTVAPGGNGRFLETFVYSVTVATVILQGFSAGWIARLLRVERPDPTG